VIRENRVYLVTLAVMAVILLFPDPKVMLV
jgi:hypothetical protein